MSRESWTGTSRRNAANSAQASKNLAAQLEALERIRAGVADIARSRERIQEQMNAFARELKKRDSQTEVARRAGREDLAQAAQAQARGLRHQFSELETQRNTLEAQEQHFLVLAQQLRASIDSSNDL